MHISATGSCRFPRCYNVAQIKEIEMKNKILPSLFAVALGLILLFTAITSFGTGAVDFIVLGVFELLVCFIYFAVGILFLFRVDEKVPVLGRIGQALTLVCYPFVYIIDLIVLMARLGAPNLSPSAWIMDILLILFFLAAFVLTVVCIFVKLELLRRIRDLALGSIVAIMLLMLVFSQDGAAVTLDNIVLGDLVLLILYGGIVFIALQDTLVFAKGRLTAKKKPAPAKEEPKPEEVEEEKPEPEANDLAPEND